MHAKYSPSAAPTWMNCPGAIKAQEGLPDRDSFESLEGTLFHTLMEKALSSGQEPSSFLGEQLAVINPDSSVAEDKQPLTVTQEMVDYGAMCMAYIDQRCAELPNVQLFSEMKVYLPVHNEPGGYDLCWGTADVILVDIPMKVIEVIDFKYGKGEMVQVENNEQLMIYLAAAVAMVASSVQQETGQEPGPEYFGELISTVLQPRAWDTDSPVKTASYTYDEMQWFLHDVRNAIALSEEGGERVPGDKQCKWCRAKSDCMAYANKALVAASASFDPVETQEQQTIRSPDSLTHEQRVAVVKQSNMVKEWMKAVHDRVMHDLMHGIETGGLKVIRGGRVNRRYKTEDDESTIRELRKLKLKVADCTRKAPLSVAEMEKWIKLNAPDKQEKFNNLWYKPEAGLKLVDEDATGEPVLLNLFEPVEGDAGHTDFSHLLT